MLYRITGIDTRTGRRQEVTIESPSEEDANNRAAELGITVTNTEWLAPRPVAPPSGPVAPSSNNEYPAINSICWACRFFGGLTVFATIVAAGINLFDNKFVFVLGILFFGALTAIGQFALAEILTLFVRIQVNTQYMCERLYSLEEQLKPAER